MRIGRALFGILCMLALIGVLRSGVVIAADDVLRITKEEAKALLGNPNVVFVDARTDSAWKGSDRRIMGAVRYDRFDPESVAGSYSKDTKFIVY